MLIVALYSSARAKDRWQNDKDSLSTQVDEVFAQWDKRDSPGCDLAVIKDGPLIFKRGYGIANLEHYIPITTTSVMDVASVSKQFTAMCILLLAEQGRVSLDDDIRKYLPEMQCYESPITIRHLIHHTSGLRE
jgi:CubicO group peptidase (beta-lactamase class C family)